MAQFTLTNPAVNYDCPSIDIDRFGETVTLAPGDTLHDEFNAVAVEYLGNGRFCGWVNIPSGGRDRWLRLSERIFTSFDEAEAYADAEWEKANVKPDTRTWVRL